MSATASELALKPMAAAPVSVVGFLSVSSKVLLMIKVLDKDECAVPFSEKSELWAGDDTLSIPSCFIMLMDSALADGATLKRESSVSLRPVCIDVS